MEKSNLFSKINLGQTGLKAGKIGISSSYGAKAEVFEAAFERGFNYFTWGTFIRGKSKEMEIAMKNIIRNGQRDQLVISMFAYAHNAYINKTVFKRGLKRLGIDYADVLLLGYSGKIPGKRLIEGAVQLKDQGLVKAIGISSHNRKLTGELIQRKMFDVYHFRYNAAHRGAEQDIFPFIDNSNKPGLISFTATRWGQLLNPKKMPENEVVPTAGECYRFVLSRPEIDICMMGVRNINQFEENMKELEKGPMTDEEINRMVKIGDYIYYRKRSTF